MGIVTEVSDISKALKVIHCSSSGYRDQGDAVQENNSPALLNNEKTIFAAYDQLADQRVFFDRGFFSNLSMTDGDGMVNLANTELKPVFEFVKKGKLVFRVWGFEAESPFFFQSGASICADGAPDAYKTGDAGSDYLANAGKPPFRGAPTDRDLDQWKWWALVVGQYNNPVMQKENDPFPGFFISTTAHLNKDYAATDPRRYVNANEIPYIVLPKKNNGGARLGDFAFIINRKTDVAIPAIYSEVGPKDSIGEISIAAAKMLNIPSNPRKGGMNKKDLFYIVFPGSGNGEPRNNMDIAENAARLFEGWGGLSRVKQIPDIQV